MGHTRQRVRFENGRLGDVEYTSVFEDIPSEQREKVAQYFEEGAAWEIRAELGRGFLLSLYHASEKYDGKKKLVSKFPIRELFGKYLPEEFEHGL